MWDIILLLSLGTERLMKQKKHYLPPRRKNSRRDLSDYQPKSGTKVAYDYAVRKKKIIINIFK